MIYLGLNIFRKFADENIVVKEVKIPEEAEVTARVFSSLPVSIKS